MNLDLVDAIVVVVGVEVKVEIDSVFLFSTSGFSIMLFPKPKKHSLYISIYGKANVQIISFFEKLE